MWKLVSVVLHTCKLPWQQRLQAQQHSRYERYKLEKKKPNSKENDKKFLLMWWTKRVPLNRGATGTDLEEHEASVWSCTNRRTNLNTVKSFLSSTGGWSWTTENESQSLCEDVVFSWTEEKCPQRGFKAGLRAAAWFTGSSSQTAIVHRRKSS